jgi:hypothetical protein
MRTPYWTLITTGCLLALAGCNKRPAQAETAAAANTSPAATAPAPAPAPAADPAEMTSEQREAARKKAAFDYATMEEGYLSDARAQWASSARASSSFNEKQLPADPKDPQAWNVTGRINGKTWSQGQQDVGMDWLELGFDKPVQATAVRAVFTNSHAVESLAKVELIDEAGAVQTVWSGISEDKADNRGPRTWVVKTFPKTVTPVKAVKLTFANNVSSGYKEVDAVQLVGE